MSAWSSGRGGPLTSDDVGGPGGLPALVERPPADDARRPPAHRRRRARAARRLFAHECAACHGEHGVEGTFVGIGGFDLLRSASDGFLRQAIRDGRPGTPMPAFGRKLGDAGIDDVLAHLRALQKSTTAPRKPPAKPPPLPLGPVPIHPHGPEPKGFTATPLTTKLDVVKAQLDAGARMALLDARAPSDYIGEHIPMPVSVPFYDPDPLPGAAPPGRLAGLLLLLPPRRIGTARAEAGAARLHQGHRPRRGPAHLEGQGLRDALRVRSLRRRRGRPCGAARMLRPNEHVRTSLTPRSTRSASTPARSRTPSPAP